MAKKAAPSAAKAPTKPAVKSASKPAPKPKTAPTAAGTTLDGVAIGHAAGDAWKLLASNGPQTLAALKKLSPGSAELTLMAVGWLAREGKVAFTTSGKTVKVGLRA
jgi:hypothetical protein